MVDTGKLPDPCVECGLQPRMSFTDACRRCFDEIKRAPPRAAERAGDQLAVMPRAEIEARERALRSFAASALTLFGASAILITSDRQARAFENLAAPLLSNGVELGLFTQDEADAFRLALHIERPEP